MRKYTTRATCFTACMYPACLLGLLVICVRADAGVPAVTDVQVQPSVRRILQQSLYYCDENANDNYAVFACANAVRMNPLAFANDINAVPGCVFSTFQADVTYPPRGPLILDDKLQAAAVTHNNLMASFGQISHQLPGEPDVGQRFRNNNFRLKDGGSENAGWNFKNAKAVVLGWLCSPGHRVNLMNCRSTRAGAAATTGWNGIYHTMNYGCAEGDDCDNCKPTPAALPSINSLGPVSNWWSALTVPSPPAPIFTLAASPAFNWWSAFLSPSPTAAAAPSISCPQVPGYVFIRGYDDTQYNPFAPAADVFQTSTNCALNPVKCWGFSTTGSLITAINVPGQWRQVAGDSCAGMYLSSVGTLPIAGFLTWTDCFGNQFTNPSAAIPSFSPAAPSSCTPVPGYVFVQGLGVAPLDGTGSLPLLSFGAVDVASFGRACSGYGICVAFTSDGKYLSAIAPPNSWSTAYFGTCQGSYISTSATLQISGYTTQSSCFATKFGK